MAYYFDGLSNRQVEIIAKVGTIDDLNSWSFNPNRQTGAVCKIYIYI